jgi:predicted metal-dependent hydrolase
MEAFGEAAQILSNGWEAVSGVIVPTILLLLGLAYIFEQRR